jgi:Flp pilus assembly protein TadG
MAYSSLTEALRDASDAVRRCNIQRVRNRAPSMAEHAALAAASAKAMGIVAERKAP